MSKAERIAEFFKRLTAAAPASTAGDAFVLVTDTFEAVEAEYAGADGRMFPPSGDYAYDVDGRPDLVEFRMVAHGTVIGSNGAILIRVRKSGAVVFEKAGADGHGVKL